MRALVIAAHGSRRAASNEEVRALASSVADAARDRYGYVALGFLELAEPGVASAIEAAIDHGAREVIVVPLLLAPGRHVSEDLPALIASAREAHSGTTIVLAPHLGRAPDLVRVVLGLAEDATER